MNDIIYIMYGLRRILIVGYKSRVTTFYMNIKIGTMHMFKYENFKSQKVLKN